MVCFGSWFEATVHHSGSTWQQDLEAAGSIVSTIRKQREMNPDAHPTFFLFFLFRLGLQPMELTVLPTVRLNLEPSSVTCPEVCFHGIVNLFQLSVSVQSHDCTQPISDSFSLSRPPSARRCFRGRTFTAALRENSDTYCTNMYSIPTGSVAQPCWGPAQPCWSLALPQPL